MKGPILRKMAVRREVMEAQMQTTQAEINLHAAVKGGQKDVERLETTFSAGNDSAAAPAAVGSSGSGPTNLVEGTMASAAASPVSLRLSDEQIEQLALRALLHLGPMMGVEGAASQAEWDEYRTEFYVRLLAFAAQKVECRINALCALAQ